MNRSPGFAVVLLTFGLAPLVIAGPIWSKELAETQGFKDLLKTVGTSLCKAAYDDSNPNAIAETMRTWGEVDEAQVEAVKDFLNRFGSYLCDSITDDSTGGSLEKLSTQTIWSGPTVSRPWNTWRSPGTSQKLTNAVMQGRRLSKVFNTVGSALCKAAYNNDNNPNALAEVFPAMNEAEIQSVQDFVKRFGSILCDSITGDNGGSTVQSARQFPWSSQELSKTEVQGFMDVAKKVGSALCKAAYEGENPNAIVESLGITDETEVQQLTDFLKRFGANLCDYVTEDSEKAANQGRNIGWAIQKETDAEEQGFFRKIGGALCGAALNRNPRAAAQLFGVTDEAEVQKFTTFLKRFGSNLCDSINDDSSRRFPQTRPFLTKQSQMPIIGLPRSGTIYYAQNQGFSRFAKKIGSALCGAAYGPSAIAESAIAQGLVDEADAQQFTDFVKRFGAHLCDYITEDNGKVEVAKQDLAQELMAALQ